MQEGAEAGELGRHIRARREADHACAPFRASGCREVLEHARVLKDERDLRTRLGEIRRIGHLRRKHLQVEAQAVVGEIRAMLRRILGSRDKVGPRREAVLRILVPVQLHAHAAHERIARKPVELRTHVVGAHVGIGDDRVRPACLVGGPLHPGRLVLISLRRPVGLHVDRLDDAEAGEVGAIFLDRIVAPDRLVGAENARLHRPDEPGKVGLPPDMMMAIDDRNHAALLRPSDRT